MNKTSIEWCDFTWNPVVGCKHGCPYCYAKKINDRFKFIPEWTAPRLFPDRLSEPSMLKKRSRIFVGSMCDLFGDWIDSIKHPNILYKQNILKYFPDLKSTAIWHVKEKL
jgi:protein gp37